MTLHQVKIERTFTLKGCKLLQNQGFKFKNLLRAPVGMGNQNEMKHWDPFTKWRHTELKGRALTVFIMD